MIYFQVKTTITLFKKTYKRLRNGMRVGSFHIKPSPYDLCIFQGPNDRSAGRIVNKKTKTSRHWHANFAE